MSCTNCFNGCTEITSDKCVRYTGVDIPELGIQNGDTLLFVEQALAQSIISALNGTGIKPTIDPSIICSVVSSNLSTCDELTTVDLTTALIKSVCDLQAGITANAVSITAINAELAALNAPYSVPGPPCFTNPVDNTSTHDVLQALLVNFCALVIGLPNTYVALDGPGGIDDIITQTLESIGLTGPVTKEYTKMVPYVAYPWFAPISVTTGNFDSNGAGLAAGPYENIYFCNGNFPGVPDLRGRVLAGVISGMAGPSLPADVNPSISILNPNYTLGMRDGTNYVALQVSEIPEHTHTATVEINDPGHDHKYTFTRVDSGSDDTAEGVRPTNIPNTLTSTEFTNLKGTAAGDDQNVFVINSLTGQNGAHKNNQPTVGCYYIMYIPA